MLLTLKCKDVDVARINYNDSGYIELKRVYEPDYLPLMAKYNNGNEQRGFSSWLAYRNVPKTRRNLEQMLLDCGVDSIEAMSIKNLGLSLSDSYWFNPEGSELTWKDVNLYQNDFTSMTQEKHSSTGQNVTFSPDSTSNGELKKHWEIRDGVRVLCKESIAPYYQQAYNEVFADKLLSKMNVPHAKYELEMIDDTPYSVCPAFTSENVEYVPAWYIVKAAEDLCGENTYDHFLRCMEALDIPVKKTDINNMLAFDFLINNSDRHYGNFGFLRNVDTLKFIGAAPLFDHGNSMWCQEMDVDISSRKQPSKPFRDTFEKQNKLIGKITADFSALSDEFIEKTIHDVFTGNKRFSERRLMKFTSILQYHKKQITNPQPPSHRGKGGGGR